MGVGGYGNNYARPLLEPPENKQVVFAVGIDPYVGSSPLWEAVQQARIPIFDDLGNALNQVDVDMVVISSPIHLHAPQTLLALAHGVPVLCEKPLAATLEEGLTMLNAQRQAGLPVGIGYQWSFSHAVQALKQDIQAGVLGRPIRLKTMVLWPRRLSYYQRSSWAGRIRMPDGEWVLDSPVNNATAHYLHNMLYILGSDRTLSAFPSQVQAELYCANAIENFDSAALRIWTESGVEVLFYSAHPVKDEVGPVMVFEFENATVTYEAGGLSEFVAEFKDGTTRNYGNPNFPHTDKLWYFLDNIQAGIQPDCGILAALSHTLCIHAIHRSVSQPVRFPHGMIRVEDAGSDPLTWVAGLSDAFSDAYGHWILPSEEGDIPWASAGAAVELKAELTRIKKD